MSAGARLESIDYLAVGHITIDESPQGKRIGGSVSYAALTARALGFKAGIVTSWGEELPLGPLDEIPIINVGAEQSTTFENIYTSEGREQHLLAQAQFLEFHMIPEIWRSPRILHLAPVAREVSPRILKYFPDSTIGLTPQGWLREWDEAGQVHAADWEESGHVLSRADVTIIGLEDVRGDLAQIERMAAGCPILVVTDGKNGCALYIHGEHHQIQALFINEVDPTGAGDIFAAAFLIRYHLSGDVIDAARFATQLASRSVQRQGLDGVPTKDELFDLMAEAHS
ncbi:MAG: PfkB family carbohydrate kinase [Anaerolineales bacterium]